MEVQIYLVRRDELRGYLAIDDLGIDDRRVRQRRLPLSLLSVACRVLEDRIPYLGPLPPTDPCVALVSPAPLDVHGVALIPMQVGERPLGLLIGHPRRSVTRALRDDLVVITHEAVLTLGRLIRSQHKDDAGEAAMHPQARDAGDGGRPAHHTISGPSGAPLAVAPASQSPEDAPRDEPVHLLTQRKISGETQEKTSRLNPGKTPSETQTASPEEHPAPRNPKTQPSSNRRVHDRELLRVEVHYTTSWGYFTGFMEDISEGGIFVTTYTRPPIGSETEVTFTIPSARRSTTIECHAIAEVRWLRDANVQGQQLPGMGLAFVEVSPPISDAIREFIGSL